MSTKTKASSASPKRSQRQGLLVVGLAGLAVIAAIVAIVASGRTGSTVSAGLYGSIPQSRTEDGAFVLGDPRAPITIVEFSDFLCPHCQDYEDATIAPFVKEFVATGRARFEYRFFPVIDENWSFATAQMAECSETLAPGSFWVAHETLFDLARSALFDNNSMQDFARRMNLNYADLLRCVQAAQQVYTDAQLGHDVGVQGTPSILLRFGDGKLQWPTGSPGRSAPDFSTLAQFLTSVLPG